jgi:hypothetical protein
MGVQSQDELVTKAEFGRRQKLGRTRVKQLVAQGLPVEGGKVPMTKAVAWLDANLDKARQNNWNGGSLNDLRRERESIKVDASRLQLARERGELVERAAVRRFLTDRARMERDQWLAWSNAAAARLASALGIDTGRLFTALEAEVRDHLRALAQRPIQDDEDQHASIS